ncbi:MAG: thiamine ABC transporter substrate-binding protein, partial [Alphaproteobacteria bacterium]|nr:thiamine ABC transporter substrate-binding protein [Alphaproteobacteria bacterium]
MLAEEDRDGKRCHIGTHAAKLLFSHAENERNRTMFRALVLAAILLSLSTLSALSEDRPELIIYTYDAFAAEWGPGPQLKAGFEAECGCTVRFVATDSSIGALRRVQLEGDTTSADIVLGLDTAIAGEARATGLFAAHGLDTSGLDLPIDWQDAEFVPVDYGYFAFVYDRTKLENPPQSFTELIARDDISILVQHPRSA